ncbi:hypothetical protein EJ04DRAFT_461652 [Polyplosphaeria fusca]|uniref:Secreted protein n=1 Tax=Polyplosphaeria fusca TaxID=682080 RepID=A0A9P4R0D1_9PLEO|nr:hypothetical protein EJ04DRAFT_461652 [Polyplosphaeria fusca]
MKYSIAPLALAAISMASPVPDAVASPPSVKISNVVSGGSGCPQGSIDVSYTDNAILPIRFSKDFTASVGPNVSPDNSRKNCQLNIALQFSPGFSYSIYSADYSGYGDLDSGVKGVVKSNYYFSGEQAQSSTSLGLQGPFSGRYTKHDDLDIAVWSPCGSSANLNVNTEVALTPLGSSACGTLAATKENVRFTQQLYIKWRQC